MSKVHLSRKDLEIPNLLREFSFKTTEDIAPSSKIIGQPRALEALEVGLGVPHQGYNIFVTGLTGTGKMTTIHSMVMKRAAKEENPGDWVYVYNFDNPQEPQALHLGKGEGRKLAEWMGNLVESLTRSLPSILTSEHYQQAKIRLQKVYSEKEQKLIKHFEAQVTKEGFKLINLQIGGTTRPDLAVMVEETPYPLGGLEELVHQKKINPEDVKTYQRKYIHLMEEMGRVYQQIKSLHEEYQKKLEALQKQAITPTLEEWFQQAQQSFDSPDAHTYLASVKEDVLKQLDRFIDPPKKEKDPYLRYRVNVVVDNAQIEGKPVVVETNPTFANLFGVVERRGEGKDRYYTDFTMIRGGSLLKANGGYLVLNFTDVLREGGVWYQLLRTLRHNALTIQPVDYYAFVAPVTMKPEPIPLNLKVIMVGERWAYHMAYRWDEDFPKIFKVLAEFDHTMPLTQENIQDFLNLLRKIIQEEGLHHFDKPAVETLLKYAIRDAGARDKVSTRFDYIADLMREAHYWAKASGAKLIHADHIQKAYKSRLNRHRRLEDHYQELLEKQTLLLDVSGKKVGVVNGLTVYDLHYHRFGIPVRITARVSLGQEGIVNIEREADMAGNILNKGTLIMAGYLKANFTRNKPLSINATLCFEQSYGSIDGDSATLGEIYALLSAIGNLPVRQDIAVTGSMNQWGEVQPVGGINEKIEGFFEVCSRRGLTGEQGVIIPKANAQDLILHPEVLQAMEEEKFHLWAIERVEEGFELLTNMKVGKPLKAGGFSRGSAYDKVDKALKEMVETYKKYK